MKRTLTRFLYANINLKLYKKLLYILLKKIYIVLINSVREKTHLSNNSRQIVQPGLDPVAAEPNPDPTFRGKDGSESGTPGRTGSDC